MLDLNASIDQHAARALQEIKLMGAMARKQIRRMAEFSARSEGQKRRFAHRNLKNDIAQNATSDL